MKRIKHAVRSLSAANFILRNIIRRLIAAGNYFRKVAVRFRVSGTISLAVEGVKIKCVARADDFMANGIYYGIDLEENLFRLIKALLPHSKNFIEVGSYTGLYSLFVSKCNPDISVLCIEPHPGNCERIRENVSLNRLTNFEVISAAAGSEKGQVQFSVPAGERLSAVGSVNKAFSNMFHGVDHREIAVQQDTLDNLIQNKAIGDRDLIKIDVEYYELSVLKGASRTLKSRPLIILEIILSERLLYNKPGMKGHIEEKHAEEVEMLLKNHGYAPYQMLSDGVYRVDSVINCPETRDFLFVPRATPARFIPYERISELFQNT